MTDGVDFQQQMRMYRDFDEALIEMISNLTCNGKRKIVKVTKLHASCVVVEFDQPKGDKYKIKITKDFDKVTLDSP